MPAPVCTDELEKLYNAIMALQGGATVTSISFGERAVSYSQAQLKDMIGLYRAFWRQCGATAGFPDLSPAAAVERGPPAKFSMF
jgi:hypothetical protein